MSNGAPYWEEPDAFPGNEEHTGVGSCLSPDWRVQLIVCVGGGWYLWGVRKANGNTGQRGGLVWGDACVSGPLGVGGMLSDRWCVTSRGISCQTPRLGAVLCLYHLDRSCLRQQQRELVRTRTEAFAVLQKQEVERNWNVCTNIKIMEANLLQSNSNRAGSDVFLRWNKQ